MELPSVEMDFAFLLLTKQGDKYQCSYPVLPSTTFNDIAQKIRADFDFIKYDVVPATIHRTERCIDRFLDPNSSVYDYLRSTCFVAL